MRSQGPLVTFSLISLVVTVAISEEDTARKAYACIELAELYFERGSDADGYAQLKRIMADFPGTDADYRARKRMVERLLGDPEDGPPSDVALMRAEGIVLGALATGELPARKQALLAYDLADALRRRSMHTEAVRVALATLAELDAGVPHRDGAAEYVGMLRYGLAVDYQALGRHEDMARAYHDLAERYPEGHSGLRAHLRLGSYYSDKDPPRAEAEFRTSLNLQNPDVYFEAHYYLADFLVKQGRETEAVPYLEALEARGGEWFERARGLYSEVLEGSEYAKEGTP